MWHLTGDMWHVRCQGWWGVNILSKYQLLSFYGLELTMSWRFWTKESPTQWINEWRIKVFIKQPPLHLVCLLDWVAPFLHLYSSNYGLPSDMLESCTWRRINCLKGYRQQSSLNSAPVTKPLSSPIKGEQSAQAVSTFRWKNSDVWKKTSRITWSSL